MLISLKQNHLQIEVDLGIYSLNVLHKCFYWYGDKFEVDIECGPADKAIIKLFFQNRNIIKKDLGLLIKKIRTDLIDFKTRDIVTSETKNVRDLLIAKAFAHSDEYDSPPLGDIEDPGLVTPKTFQR